jgi:hypothetical protein
MDGSQNAVVAVLKERQEAGKADDGVDELREKLLRDKEEVTYLSWYGKFREGKQLERKPAFTQMVNQEAQTWLESGGTIAGQKPPGIPETPLAP